MNAHELTRLINDVEGVELEDIDGAPSYVFTPTMSSTILEALEELQARRKASGDDHGLEAPS